jgi:hypothetical protein
MPTPEEIVQNLLKELYKDDQHKLKPPKIMIPSLMDRTVLAVDKYRGVIVEVNGVKQVRYQNAYYPMVNRDLRNFNQRVFSLGASSSREILMLDPESQALKDAYAELLKNIIKGASTLDIIKEISKVTQKVFPEIETSHLKTFVSKLLQNGTPFVSLSTFMTARIGVCRQHALLNAYLMSKLVEDKLLQGEVIHQRHTFPGQGAHTWNLFRDAKDGKLYSLDSLWKSVASLADNPGTLNQLYGLDVETGIKGAFGDFQLPSKQKAHPKSTLRIMPSINPALLDRLIEKESSPKHLLIDNNEPYDNFDPLISPQIESVPKNFWVEDEELEDNHDLVLSPKVASAPEHLLVEDDEPDDHADLVLSPRVGAVPKHLWSEDEEPEDYQVPVLSPKVERVPKHSWVEDDELEDNHELVLSPKVERVPKHLWVEDDELDDDHELVLSPKVESVPKHLWVKGEEPDDNPIPVLSPKDKIAPEELEIEYSESEDDQDLIIEKDKLNRKLDHLKILPIENNFTLFKKPSKKQQLGHNEKEKIKSMDENLEIINYIIKDGLDDSLEKINAQEYYLDNNKKSF